MLLTPVRNETARECDFEHFWWPPMSYLHGYPAEGYVPKDNVALYVRNETIRVV